MCKEIDYSKEMIMNLTAQYQLMKGREIVGLRCHECGKDRDVKACNGCERVR